MLTDLLKHIDYLHTLPRGDKKRLEAAYIIRLVRYYNRLPYYKQANDQRRYEAKRRQLQRVVDGIVKSS